MYLYPHVGIQDREKFVLEFNWDILSDRVAV